MKTITEHLRDRLYSTSEERDSNSLASLKISEKSNEFRKLKNNRLIMGSLRYHFKIGDPRKPQYDRIDAILKYLDMYKATGNLENLVDISNLAELEFVEGDHPHKHFKAADDGWHTKRKVE